MSTKDVPARLTRPALARRIDHTLLKAEATRAQIERLCEECRVYGFAAACVNPVWVPLCAEWLAGSESVVATVVGFPLGASATRVKAEEARCAVEDGAREVDMVVQLGALVAGEHALVRDDIAAVVDAARRARADAIIKVILETRALTHEQIIAGCRATAEAQADFVKTSTGFHAGGGATVEHVALLRRHAAPIRVKASGGIRDLAAARAMLDAGADRLGTSASVAIVEAMEAER